MADAQRPVISMGAGGANPFRAPCVGRRKPPVHPRPVDRPATLTPAPPEPAAALRNRAVLLAKKINHGYPVINYLLYCHRRVVSTPFGHPSRPTAWRAAPGHADGALQGGQLAIVPVDRVAHPEPEIGRDLIVP